MVKSNIQWTTVPLYASGDHPRFRARVAITETGKIAVRIGTSPHPVFVYVRKVGEYQGKPVVDIRCDAEGCRKYESCYHTMAVERCEEEHLLHRNEAYKVQQAWENKWSVKEGN